ESMDTSQAGGNTVNPGLNSAVNNQDPKQSESPQQDQFLDRLFKKIADTSNKAPRKIHSRSYLRGKKKIGQGGLGVVYAYHDRSLMRIVALKVAKSQVIHSPGRLDRFLRERRITARLQHPGIPPVYQCGELADGRPYYSMRLVEGSSLAQQIKEFYVSGGSASHQDEQFGKLLDSFLQVCDGIAYAHQQQIVHRDLKPGNVMVESDGTTFVVDWGLAREMGNRAVESPDAVPDADHAEEEESATRDGQQLGSLDYMSPEQASGSTSLHSPLTDIYGLGAILFQVITGKAPHARTDENQEIQIRLNQIATSPPPDATEVSPNAPAELASICKKAMALNPEQRYQSAGQLRNEIQRWRRREIVVAHQKNYSVLQKLELVAGKHRRAISLGVIVLAVMFFGASWATLQVSQAADETNKALVKQRQTNQQLLSSLENFADAVMTEDVLAVPQLAPL
ncbi:MAG: serine/threonine protein kinase, partial [Planctomycetaceae bacterium]|nr:serine/threonine protein kinase [Planctomycetaceae bacterium]